MSADFLAAIPLRPGDEVRGIIAAGEHLAFIVITRRGLVYRVKVSDDGKHAKVKKLELRLEFST